MPSFCARALGLRPIAATWVMAAIAIIALTIPLQASRLGSDKDGRLYTITISAQDNAGKQTSSATTVVAQP
jgi:hypothetical protein